jgi:hypothetical protein
MRDSHADMPRERRPKDLSFMSCPYIDCRVYTRDQLDQTPGSGVVEPQLTDARKMLFGYGMAHRGYQYPASS